MITFRIPFEILSAIMPVKSDRHGGHQRIPIGTSILKEKRLSTTSIFLS